MVNAIRTHLTSIKRFTAYYFCYFFLFDRLFAGQDTTVLPPRAGPIKQLYQAVTLIGLDRIIRDTRQEVIETALKD